MSRREQFLDLAAQKFGPLTNADVKLFCAVVDGIVADYRSLQIGDNNPATAETWGAERVLQANRITWLCSSNEAMGFISHRGIQLMAVRIDGLIDLDYIRFAFPLVIFGCRCDGGLSIRHARISSLLLSGTHSGPISGDGVYIDGGLYMRNGFRATGEVRFLNAHIREAFNCQGGNFLNKNALTADGISVDGSVFLTDNFRATGEVRFHGAMIGGSFDCGESELTNEGSYTLNCQRMHVIGNLFIRGLRSMVGRVSLVLTQVDGGLQICSIENAQSMSLDLRGAKVARFLDDLSSWPSQGNLLLDGFIYDSLDNAAPHLVSDRIKWLRLRPPDKFYTQPYEQLAAVLDKEGHDRNAQEVRIQKNIDRAKFEDLNWYKVLWTSFLYSTIAFGYRPWKVWRWAFLFILLGTGFFAAADRAHVMIPIEDHPPGFNALAYSVDEFLPIVNLHQGDYWTPSIDSYGVCTVFGKLSIPISGAFLCYYLWLHIIVGWALASLLVAALTGIVRK